MEEKYVTDNGLTCLEPLMPGEDAPSPQTQERNYSNAIKETENILAEAEALKA